MPIGNGATLQRAAVAALADLRARVIQRRG